MNEREFQELLEKMRRDKKIKTPILSAYVNMVLRSGNIEKIYKYISKDTYKNMIILRSIIKQYLKSYCMYDLKLSSLSDELDDNIIILYKAAVLEDSKAALEAFVKSCDLIYYYEK